MKGQFYRSSLCGGTNHGPHCVEVKMDQGASGTVSVVVRNSESPGREVSFSPDEWRAFVSGVKKDEFNV